jgi:putative copper resistance protein D
LDDPLIYARAVHFAATLTVAGIAFFFVFIAEPAFRKADQGTRLPAVIRRRLAWIAWIAIVLSVLSGAAWLVVVAQSISDRTLTELFSEGILSTVLTQTGFGRDWLARFVLACLLAAIFVPFLSAQGMKSAWIKTVMVALAAGLVGSLAWAGHAAGGSGVESIVHPAADFLHLVAAAAWVGMLVPLVLLLAAAGGDAASVAVARIATMRFSNIGIISVGTLLLTGSVNTWYLAGSIPALTQTDYGRLLLTKVALFLTMVAIAAVNRLRLTPQLVQNVSAAADPLRQLRRNTMIEVAIGAIVIAIVAVLGVTVPGYLDQMLPAHHHLH